MWLDIRTAPPPSANRPEERAEPRDARRVEPVRRLVQDEDLRLAEQRRRQREALAHPEREAPDLRAGVVLHPGERQDGVGAGVVQSTLEAHDPQVIARCPPGMEPGDLERRSDAAERRVERTVRTPEDVRLAGRRGGEPQQDAHRRRLARAVRPEEAGHAASRDREAQAVHGEPLPVPLRQVADRDRLGRGAHGGQA
jgi:hypothetical protein